MTVLNPKDEAELAEAIASAKGPLAIRGGGTRPIGRRVDGEELSTSAMSGITLYEPGALTLVARAGTPVAEIEAALAAEGQMLAFEPMDHRALLETEGVPTIGGVVAGNVSGPRRVQAGACRDFLLGVGFVDGRGDIVKSGGRVMKNVTGYDLVKLMAGSRGTLGVLTEVSLKVLPKPEATATLVYPGRDLASTSAIFAGAITSPFEATGAARLPSGSFGDQGAVLVRLDGFPASVDYRAKALAKHLDDVAGPPEQVIRDEGHNSALWRDVRDATPLAETETDIWRLSIKPTDIQNLATIVSLDHMVIDWSGGLVWVASTPRTDLRARLINILGHATIIRSSDETKSRLGVFQTEPPQLAEMAKRLRQQFDPRGILNPGLMS